MGTAIVISILVALAALFFIVFSRSGLDNPEDPKQGILVQNPHIWVTTNGSNSIAAFVVWNYGREAVSIHTIRVGGHPVPISDWRYNSSLLTKPDEIRETEPILDETLGSINMIPGGDDEIFTNAANPIQLQRHQAAIIYLANPLAVQSSNIGGALTLTVQAGETSSSESVSVIHG